MRWFCCGRRWSGTKPGLVQTRSPWKSLKRLRRDSKTYNIVQNIVILTCYCSPICCYVDLVLKSSVK